MLLLLKSNPSRQHSKALYCWELGEEEDRKTQKSRSEEKAVGLAQPLYSQQGNERVLPRVEPRGGEPREPAPSKAGKTSDSAVALQIHSLDRLGRYSKETILYCV